VVKSLGVVRRLDEHYGLRDPIQYRARGSTGEPLFSPIDWGASSGDEVEYDPTCFQPGESWQPFFQVEEFQGRSWHDDKGVDLAADTEHALIRVVRNHALVPPDAGVRQNLGVQGHGRGCCDKWAPEVEYVAPP
jgi:hypothetical protein